MPRKGSTAEAEQKAAADPLPKTPKEPREQLPPREPGPTTTRSGAQALAVETEQGVRTFTAGGEKGERIRGYLTDRPDLTRKQIAELVGCSQSRVAEVARVLGLTKAREAKAEAAEADAS